MLVGANHRVDCGTRLHTERGNITEERESVGKGRTIRRHHLNRSRDRDVTLVDSSLFERFVHRLLDFTVVSVLEAATRLLAAGGLRGVQRAVFFVSLPLLGELIQHIRIDTLEGSFPLRLLSLFFFFCATDGRVACLLNKSQSILACHEEVCLGKESAFIHTVVRVHVEHSRRGKSQVAIPDGTSRTVVLKRQLGNDRSFFLFVLNRSRRNATVLGDGWLIVWKKGWMRFTGMIHLHLERCTPVIVVDHL